MRLTIHAHQILRLQWFIPQGHEAQFVTKVINLTEMYLSLKYQYYRLCRFNLPLHHCTI